MKKMKLVLFMTLITVLVLQACSTASNKSVEGSNEGAKSVGGELVVLRASDATSLDPHFITDIPSANIIHGKVYETLVAFDRDRKIAPLLAKEWEQKDDVTWTFILNEGIKFHDGADFNAEAVKATFDRILDPETGSPQRDKLSMISEVVVDDTFVVTLTLSSNKDYWGTVPKVDKVTFKVVPEDSTRLAMIESGEAHIAEQVPVTEIDRIENSSTMNLFRAEGLAVEFIGFNVKDALLSDVKVRQAVSYAVDREAIISGIYDNVGTLANSAMSPKIIGYSSETKPYDYDVVKAKELLKEAGVKEGTKVKLLTSDRKERINMAEVIQSQLKGIGLDVDIQVMEYGAFISEITKEQHQIFISGWGNATGDADYNQFNLFHTASMGPPGNHFYYSNPEIDKLIEQGRSESNQEARNEIYKKAMQMELDDAVYIPVRNYEHLAVYSNAVKGFWLDASNYTMISGVEIVE